jgi:formate dehydrogenase subunit gamma
MTSASSPDTAVWTPAVTKALERLKDQPGALLPILHAVQDEVGYIPSEAVAVIAQGLNLSRAEVHGVVSFYHDFRGAPAGRHRVRICRSESCQALGAEALVSRAQSHLGVELHHTTPDGAVTLEPVYCLGNCALSPAIQVDGMVHGRVTGEQLDALLDRLEEA